MAFLVPGLGMVLLGIVVGAVSLFNAPSFGRQWQLHTLIAASMFAIVGAQVAQLGVFSRTYAYYYLGEHDRCSTSCARASGSSTG